MRKTSSAERTVQRAVEAARRNENFAVDGDDPATVARIVGRARDMARFGGHDPTLITAASPACRYVNFGDVAVERCREQCQYASRAVDGRHGYPNLGQGLRFIGDPRDYHSLLIHDDDVETFVARWNSRVKRS